MFETIAEIMLWAGIWIVVFVYAWFMWGIAEKIRKGKDE